MYRTGGTRKLGSFGRPKRAVPESIQRTLTQDLDPEPNDAPRNARNNQDRGLRACSARGFSKPVGTMKSFVIKGEDIQMSSWQMKIQDVNTEIDKLWLLVRYGLR